MPTSTGGDERYGERMGFSSTMRRASEHAHVWRIVQAGARGLGSAGKQELRDAVALGRPHRHIARHSSEWRRGGPAPHPRGLRLRHQLRLRCLGRLPDASRCLPFARRPELSRMSRPDRGRRPQGADRRVLMVEFVPGATRKAPPPSPRAHRRQCDRPHRQATPRSFSRLRRAGAGFLKLRQQLRLSRLYPRIAPASRGRSRGSVRKRSNFNRKQRLAADRVSGDHEKFSPCSQR